MAGTKTLPKPRFATDANTAAEARTIPPWQIVLLDDDDHSYEYVIVMLREVFGYPAEKGFQLAREVDTAGRVIVFTGPLEHAELKRDLIHGYGADFRIRQCVGSMSAVLEQV